MGDTCIHLSYFTRLLFVFALCEPFSLPSCSQTYWLLLFIPIPVALVSVQLAVMQLTWAYASAEAHRV